MRTRAPPASFLVKGRRFIESTKIFEKKEKKKGSRLELCKMEGDDFRVDIRAIQRRAYSLAQTRLSPCCLKVKPSSSRKKSHHPPPQKSTNRFVSKGPQTPDFMSNDFNHSSNCDSNDPALPSCLPPSPTPAHYGRAPEYKLCFPLSLFG